MPGIQGVIFDMDGVLTDSEPVINAAAIAGLREYGVCAAPEDFAPFVGMGEDRYIGGVAEKYGLAYLPEMKRRVYEIYLEILPAASIVFPGVHRLLSDVRDAGLSMAVASSADRVKVVANLEAAQRSGEIGLAGAHQEAVALEGVDTAVDAETGNRASEAKAVARAAASEPGAAFGE